MLLQLPWWLMVKNPPAVHEVQETQVFSLGKDLLEMEIATHSSVLAWEMAWAEEPGGYSPRGGKRVRQSIVTKQQHS